MRVPYNPRPYQQRMEQFLLRTPNAALWAEMGLGKTAATLFALAKLLAGGEATQVLVIAPKRVAEHTWPSEIEKWQGLASLSYRVLPVKTCVKSQHHTYVGRQVREWVPPSDGNYGNHDIHVVGRENFPYLAEGMQDDWPYDTVVIDEACGFKNHKSMRFKGLRIVHNHIDRLIELTGTPAAEGYLELWAQVWLLDRGERLGRTFSAYRTKYFESDYMGYSYTLRAGARKIIHRDLADICLTLRTEDYLWMPDRTDMQIDTPLTSTQMEKYRQMARQYVLQLDGEGIVADTAAILASKLLQLANGIIYTNVYDDTPRTTIGFSTSKLDALEQLIEQADGPVLVAYSFRADRERILKRIKGARVLDDANSIDQWNAGQIPVALIHPASAAGLNLQDGGNVLVWYGLCWSLRQYLQTCARLLRQGQTKPVFIYFLVTPGTYDEQVIAALGDKETGQQKLLAALRDEVRNDRSLAA